MAKKDCQCEKEGDMAEGNLRSVAKNALLIESLIEKEKDLPEWVEGKLTLAADYLNSVAEYLQHSGEDRDTDFAEESMKGPDPCWKGYEMVGQKELNGKKVPNCVKSGSEYSEVKVPTGWNVTTSAGAPAGIPSRKSHFTGDQDA